jgi:UDP-glucuronate decarboxylase
MNRITEQDLDRIFHDLTDKEREKFSGRTILMTGCAGFLGFYLMQFFARYASELHLKKIIGLDNFRMGYPLWLKNMASGDRIELHTFDIVDGDITSIPSAMDADYILHMASIASPTFYRKYPIETLDANVWGLRKLLDFYREKGISNLLFFSSSEIYGDPDPASIPTPETYRGFVECIGPRACYDEAKRFGETMCYLYHQCYHMPITIVRPFNNYGPGMRLNDRRVPADFAKAVMGNQDIVLFSDGTPTRTFCYISDSITGFLKALVYEPFEVFNIGIDKPEISILRLAEIYREAGHEILGYTGNILYQKSEEENYLINNPNRRCPDIGKAKTTLGYCPKVLVEDGVQFFLQYISQSRREELTW